MGYVSTCSPDKRRIYPPRAPRKTTQCEICKKTFISLASRSPRFCGKLCWSASLRKAPAHCLICGLAVPRNNAARRRFCSRVCFGVSRRKAGSVERERHRNGERWRRRRAREKAAVGTFTAQEWVDLCAQYDNQCLCCGKATKLVRDHVRPLALGGTNDISNIQPLCQPCNRRKGTSSTDYRDRSLLPFMEIPVGR